jgi:hypothetical protein
MSAYGTGPAKPIILTERNGAPRHEDAKMAAIVEAAVERVVGRLEERHREEMQAVRSVAEKVERGFSAMAKTFEAFTIGDKSVAVAAVVDGESKELPNMSRYKADPVLIFRLKATDIASELGIPYGMVNYLLNKNGLDWANQRSEFWNSDFFRMTKRRLWHPLIVAELRAVILDPSHPERAGASKACLRRLDEAAALLKSADA